MDPNGLIEDKSKVKQDKLTFVGQIFTNPNLLNDYHNGITDICNYLITLKNYDGATFRDYHRMVSQ